jgi:hypothetical protein
MRSQPDELGKVGALVMEWFSQNPQVRCFSHLGSRAFLCLFAPCSINQYTFFFQNKPLGIPGRVLRSSDEVLGSDDENSFFQPPSESQLSLLVLKVCPRIMAHPLSRLHDA